MLTSFDILAQRVRPHNWWSGRPLAGALLQECHGRELMVEGRRRNEDEEEDKSFKMIKLFHGIQHRSPKEEEEEKEQVKLRRRVGGQASPLDALRAMQPAKDKQHMGSTTIKNAES